MRCAPPPHTRISVQAMRALVLSLTLAAALAAGAAPAAAKAVAKKGAYGAIALHRDSGQFGYAQNAATSRAAKTEALRQCAHARCEVVAAFSNACGALVREPARGPAGYYSATGATRDEAETKALRRCPSRGCEPVAWACTK